MQYINTCGVWSHYFQMESENPVNCLTTLSPFLSLNNGLCIFLSTAVWNHCLAKICIIKKLPDPKHDFKMRWVLPYKKEILCTCTKIVFHKCRDQYSFSPSEAREHLYTDDPLLFVNSNDEGDLQHLLGCIDSTGRFLDMYWKWWHYELKVSCCSWNFGIRYNRMWWDQAKWVRSRKKSKFIFFWHLLVAYYLSFNLVKAQWSLGNLF